MIDLVCNLKDSIQLMMLPFPPNLGTSGSSCFYCFRRACHCMLKLANVLQLILAGVMDRPTWVYYLVVLAATIMLFFDLAEMCMG